MRKVPNANNTDQPAADTSVDGLDDVDRGILRLLQEDGRMPYRQIARELGVSEGTVRIRSSRMQESGALNVIAIADPFRLGYSVLAFVLIRVEPGMQDTLVEELTALDESTYVSTCIGRADIYMQVVCRDNQHLHHLLHQQIPALGGVRDLEAFMELEMHKVSYRYNLS